MSWPDPRPDVRGNGEDTGREGGELSFVRFARFTANTRTFERASEHVHCQSCFVSIFYRVVQFALLRPRHVFFLSWVARKDVHHRFTTWFRRQCRIPQTAAFTHSNGRWRESLAADCACFVFFRFHMVLYGGHHGVRAGKRAAERFRAKGVGTPGPGQDC